VRAAARFDVSASVVYRLLSIDSPRIARIGASWSGDFSVVSDQWSV